MIRKIQGGYQVDVQPGGRAGRRIRKVFPTKRQAEQFERETMLNSSSPEFQPVAKDLRLLSDIVNQWFELHGVNLKAVKDTKSRLDALVLALGNPRALDFSASMFADYRSARLLAGVAPGTLNRERSYLRACFQELIRLGLWSRPNPLATLRPIKQDRSEMSYLSSEQIKLLMVQVGLSSNPDLPLVVRVALSTGARWSEVLGLDVRRVRLSPGLVTFAKTKAGKGRSVPVSDGLASALVERLSKGRFLSCYAAFRSALERSAIQLPKGQCAHVLRHTFASHYVMAGGSLLALQKVLGHSSLTVTQIYAHLSPDHMRDVVLLNPFTRCHSVDTGQ